MHFSAKRGIATAPRRVMDKVNPNPNPNRSTLTLTLILVSHIKKCLRRLLHGVALGL